MKITITADIDEDEVDGDQLTEETYEQVVDFLMEVGCSDIRVNLG